MSLDLRKRLFDELNALVLVDPHTHINPLDPASHSLADILGYHYYTELAHSAGMDKDKIEEPGLPAREKVRRLIENLGPLDNTIQYSWLVEMAQAFFGLEADAVTPDNWEAVYAAADAQMAQPDWPQQVLERSKLEAVFLTNDFDDALAGFDTDVYVPCLRTDDLVFHLAKPEVRRRLTVCTGVVPGDAQALKKAIAALFTHFKGRGARACAVSLPPDFAPRKVSPARANTALAAINAEEEFAPDSHKKALSHYVFWTLAEMCVEYRLPFDLMIGVNRNVYQAGVHQGRDLYDSRVSLIQYKELFNAFPQVTFPISVLASVTNQELASYAWIFPNVVTNGHWWYSNTPSFIEHDLAARLEAVPRTKQIAYYSDMYKLEFALPKFAMFKRILAKVLAERFVIDRGWSEERAVELGTQVLRGNTERIFRWGEDLREEMPVESVKKTYFIEPTSASVTAATGSLLTPHDAIRIEPPKDDEPLAASEDVDLGVLDAPAGGRDLGHTTLPPPSRAEIAQAATELGVEDLEELSLAPDAPATGAAQEVELANLEVLDESAAGAEPDSGTLSLEEVATPQERETFSMRQTERFRDVSGEESPGSEATPSQPVSQRPAAPEQEPPKRDTDDWDFLDTRKK
jgi:glucuronate isomerase